MPLTAGVLLCAGIAAADKLVLDLELDRRPISLSHNVDGFLYPSDLKNFNRFRPKIRFVIYPADGQ